jgi:hypothetical protein
MIISSTIPALKRPEGRSLFQRWEIGMRRILRAAAFAVATFVSFSIGGAVAPAAAQDVTLTTYHVSMLKRTLRLTAAQEPYWHKIEATVREIAAEQASDNGIVHRVSTRVASFTLNNAALQRIAAAARPLLASLDDAQRHDAMTAVRSLGVASLF